MHAENFGPSAVPTFIAIWNWLPRPTLGPLDLTVGPLWVVVVDDVIVVESETLAIPGEPPPPPPQPAASSTKALVANAEVSIMGRRQRMAEEITPIRLQQGNRSCYLCVTGAAASLRPAEGG
jgi:hypothetical protein